MLRKQGGLKRYIVVLSLIALVCNVPYDVVAQSRRPTLELGTSFDAVLKSWGSPTEKEERESRRIDIWRYGKSSVTFKEGKVVSWKDGDAGASVVPGTDRVIHSASVKNEESPAEAPKQVDNAVVEEILAEIMKEPASADTVEPKSGPIAPIPGQPVPMQPAEIVN